MDGSVRQALERLPPRHAVAGARLAQQALEVAGNGGESEEKEERGEELGINSMYSEEKERQALQDAISRDRAEGGDDSLVVS